MNNYLLIFDLDDTLIITNPEFEKTNVASAEIVSTAIFGDLSQVENILKRQRAIDLELVTQYGFVRPRFLHSWLRTLDHFAKENNTRLKGSDVHRLGNTVQDIYNRKYENIPGMIEVIKELKAQGYSMVILTAGEEDVQNKRVHDSGVVEFMDAIHVYSYKTPATLQEVMDKYPNKSAYHMIGNSLKSDIHPALTNDIWGIHVVRETWEADNYNIDDGNPKYVQIQSIKDLPIALLRIHQSEVA